MIQKQEIILINGPVGTLETIYLPAHGEAQGVAVINHPNPVHGGTFTNKVVQTAAKALTQLGFHCYLPNLRGVGNSAGEFEYGVGEIDDCCCVIDFARERHPEVEKLVIGGFSFGGYVAVHAAQRRDHHLLLLMGPAVRHYERVEPLAARPEHTLLIHGQIDEVIELDKALLWASEQDIPVVVLPQASHFFHGKLIPLRDTILRLAPALLRQNHDTE